MTAVRPFRALRYDAALVDLDRVIAPPYDVVTAEERKHYWERDPHGAIRLELTREVGDEATTDYAEVAEALAAWQRAGVLRRDARPAIYGLRQRFRGPQGELRTREGFFALLHLEDYARRVVRPHERTLAGPKADRLKLLRATRANLSSIFLLYEDPERELSGLLTSRLDGAPLLSARDGAGVEHALVAIEDGAALAAVERFLAERPVVIADGHHRYETALAYRDERRRSERSGDDAPFEWTLGYFTDAYAPGSLLLPIHRVVRERAVPSDAEWASRLPGWRAERVACPAAEEIPALLARHLVPLADRPAFAADDGSGVLRVLSRAPVEPGELGIRAIHAEVLARVFGLDEAAVRDGAVAFPKHALEAARDVREGRGTVALYLNPLRPEQVFRVTGAGELLPQKSTFFMPKIPTGLVFRPLDEPAP